MPKGVYERKPRRPVAERFWSKVDKNGPTLRPELGQCWTWTASIGSHGYGQIQTGGGPTTAHRFSWELANGPIPIGDGHHGTCVLHRCDNRACVNPSHLFLGTHQENVADMVAKSRHFSQTKPDRVPRGERHFKARLDEAKVVAIRQLYDAGDVSQCEIARRFSVSKYIIYSVVHRRSWKHVA